MVSPRDTGNGNGNALNTSLENGFDSPRVYGTGLFSSGVNNTSIGRGLTSYDGLGTGLFPYLATYSGLGTLPDTGLTILGLSYSGLGSLRDSHTRLAVHRVSCVNLAGSRSLDNAPPYFREH